MTHLMTSDDEYRDLIYDDAYRSYLITRTNSLNDYRFNRMYGKHTGVRGFLKIVIRAIAASKLRRLERELELRGIRYDRRNNDWVVCKPDRTGVRQG
ncbi:hypothetical protein ASC80_01020 [Afipia sp. Root123D2]|uniref:hypothetical protein n=1 Tax=Afipia sp. Root123D2 TaxID=1736436 RepID=UPI00070090B4|nr:hypothetical protein [Afipia sp. Root123D2]KQW22014.1 hypothetical protein ASC80_01020 [Afipia sp. Root123D2]